MTESDDPAVAALIQSHVSRMYQRLARGQGIPMRGMSATLPVLMRQATSYHRQLEITPSGVAVTETAEEPELIAVIREHGEEVSGFVNQGRLALCDPISEEPFSVE